MGGGGGYDLGSLNLIKADKTFVIRGTRHGGKGSKGTTISNMSNQSCDYVIMNPPFSRAKYKKGQKERRVVPFDLFGIEPETQIKMGIACRKLFQFKGSVADGNAGLGTNFMTIADKKLKPGGKLAFILPRTFLAGESWNKVRKLLTEKYRNMMIVLVKYTDRTFSSETDMNELMLIAEKIPLVNPETNLGYSKSEIGSSRVTLVLLDRLPNNALEAIELARIIQRTKPPYLENSVDQTSITLGEYVIGKTVSCPIEQLEIVTGKNKNGKLRKKVLNKWWATSVDSIDLLVFAYKFVNGISLNDTLDSKEHEENNNTIEMIRLGKIAKLGPYFLDIYGTDKTEGIPRGPFTKRIIRKTAKFPALWNVKSQTQKTILTNPDCSLEIRVGQNEVISKKILERAKKRWELSSHSHLSLRTRYTTQCLIASFTEKPTLGGNSWPNIVFDRQRPEFEKIFVLWMNSIFGILTYWIMAGSQQQGRGILDRITILNMPIINFNKLNEIQIKELVDLFNEVKRWKLKKINSFIEDDARRYIDKKIIEILQIHLNSPNTLEWLYETLSNESQMRIMFDDKKRDDREDEDITED